MKKTMFIISLVVFGLLAINTAKAAEPTCDVGQHYEGSLVESQVTNRVCTRKIWNICVHYENQVTTVSNWVGSCVADEVILPEEPVITPEEPKVIISSGIPLFELLKSYCKDENVAYTPWSSCDTRFGANGLQYRDLLPSNNGCKFTTMQQVNRIRECIK